MNTSNPVRASLLAAATAARDLDQHHPGWADVSIRGNFIGQSPLNIPAPANYTGTEPIKIEVRLEGYEPEEVMFGDYHPPVDQALTKMVESETMIYRAPAGTKTIPAYYTYGNSVTIKLYPRGK